ncbi:P-loop containing nucleoside triphosphate hydrolase protein, partial [Lentinula edodes]
KILSKKEKEKLKKEREKADTQEALLPSEPIPEENDREVDEGGKADSKNKKKKKKTKKDEEPPPPPPPTTKKKGGISALKAMMEEKKRLEEEARRAEEEERRRIEEEERKAEEEAKRKEEEKQRKKEKEKAKRELAKKEGRLLTKKQKEEKAAAEIRKQALLASGVQIEGLQQSTNMPTKKVVYSNRKKKGPTANGASPASSRPRTPESPVVQEEKKDSILNLADGSVSPAHKLEEAEDASAKDDWDASSDEETKPASDGKKDSWDASSDEGAELKPTPSYSSTGKSPSKSSDDEDSAEDSDSDASSEEDSSEEDSDSDEESSEDELSTAQKLAAQRKVEAAARRAKAHEAALAARSKDDLRSPICCILGHVDTGKTKLLDKIRQTNVQEGEAGGITQQIGATYFPVDAIMTKTAVMNRDGGQEYKIPGLLVIDTPGHESFTNLRSRGSSLCNIAILVVDIMHGLEAQTLESLRLLRDRKTPFIVALNKIDRLYGWQPTPDGAFRESLAKQTRAVQREFEDRVAKTTVAFAEEGLNAVLYYDNKNFARNVSLVPTSAITGEGVPDMIMLLVNLTQQRMSDRLMYLSELECTVLEVKVIEGLGTTIDVVLSNGILREGDKIVVCGLNGPIVTQVRALLTPQPLRELRIKSAYVHHKEVKAALGVKITAPDLEKAIAGSRLLVCGPDDDEDDLKEEVMSDLATLLNNIDKSGRGVCVQASTLGSLEALLDFLKSSKIPVSGINIGPVHKKDVMRSATMLEKARELACILCFDVPVDKDAERMAEEMGIRLFKADIIYHLFDKFTAYNQEITEAKRRDAAPQAIWPCRLKIIAAFCKRDPIILGVDILDGTLRVGTPIAVVKVDPTTQKKEIIDLGKVTSLEINHKSMDIVKKSQAGGGVAVKIEHAVYQSAKMFGRHFDDKDELLSHITRQSIDVLKSSFRTDVSNEEWLLIKALKPVSLSALGKRSSTNADFSASTSIERGISTKISITLS